MSIAHRTVAYIRVSTDDQATEGFSLGDQERSCRAYAVARDWPEVAEVYADAGVSGATRDRPALKRLLTDAKAGTVERVIINKLDRMSRRAVDLLAIEDDLDQCGVERVYIKDSIDTSSPTGRLLRTVLAAVAELERDMILERTAAGKAEAVRRGEVWRPSGLLGYRYVPVDKQNGHKAGLEIDEETAPLVRRIFAAVANGTSLHALSAQLNADGVPTVRGGTMWRHNTLQRIIVNSAYWGRATYGRQRRVKGTNGKSALRRGIPDKIMYVDVPAIVSSEEAQAAQAAVARNKAMSKRNTKHEYLLGGGLLRCGVRLDDGPICGSVMHGESGRGTSYRCSHARPEGSRRHGIPTALLDNAVWSALCATLRDPSAVLQSLEALADAGSTQATELEAELSRLERAVQDVATQQDRLLDLYLTQRVDEAAYTAKAGDLAAKRLSFMDQQDALSAQRDAAVARQLPIADVKAACAHIASALETLSFARKQHLVRTLVQSITATREIAHVDGVFAALSTTVPLDDGGIDGTTSHRPALPAGSTGD